MQDPWFVDKKFGSFLSNFFMQFFQYFQIEILVDCLSIWYKFIKNNPANISSRTLLSVHVFYVTLTEEFDVDIKKYV
jgi:hypothetical protein